jgi:DNA-binding LacI/PurR family transcriptional regulator
MVNAALRLLGLVPGVDVCVTGYDAYWWQAPMREHCPDPPWATIDKGNQQLGVACVDLLLARIAGTLPATAQRRVIAPRGILSGAIGPGQSPPA